MTGDTCRSRVECNAAVPRSARLTLVLSGRNGRALGEDYTLQAEASEGLYSPCYLPMLPKLVSLIKTEAGRVVYFAWVGSVRAPRPQAAGYASSIPSW